MKVKIVGITKKNFQNIPRPANHRFNCQECFYWMEKRDGRTNLTKQKKKWLARREKRCNGCLAKLLLLGARQVPAGFVQFGPISEFDTLRLLYRDTLTVPKGGWCIVCVAIQSHYRGQGLATRLVRNVLRDLRRRGVRTIDAYPLEEINSWNQISQGPVQLWEKCGFETVAKIKPVKGEPKVHGEREVTLMRKKW